MSFWLYLLVYIMVSSKDHHYSTCAKFSEKLTLLFTRTCACQGVRNVNFSENFAKKFSEKYLIDDP